MNKNHVETSRKNFNALQQKYQNLSFNDQMAYMNRDKPGDGKLRIVSQDGAEALRSIALDKPSKYNFIEIDHLDKEKGIRR